MKIAYVFAYFGDGGAEEHAFLLAKKAKEAGHEVLFIISKSSNSALKKLQNGKFEIIYLPMESSFRPGLVLRSATSLKKLIKSRKIDVVHTHMLREHSLAVVAKLFGSKIVLIRTFHRLDQFDWKMKPLLPIYFKYTDAVISTSMTMSDYLNFNGWKDRFVLIENGVAKVEAAKHEKALGFIGRLANEKGILGFIKANIDILRENKLVIAGDGPDFNNIKEIINDKKLNIELLGNVSNKSDFYKKISVLILPSETEVLPLVVIEAYSCGLPVVAFEIKSLKSLIHNDNGALVVFPDYGQMAKIGLKIMANSNTYLRTNIDIFEQKYSDDIMWSKTSGLYESTIRRQRHVVK